MSIVRTVRARLRPTGAQIQRLASRETDPRQAAAFEPLVLGRALTVSLLAFIAAAAIVLAPLRLLFRWYGERHES